MAFQACPGVAELVLVFTEGTNIMENVLHVRHSDGSNWTAAQLQALMDTTNTWYTGNMKAHMVSTFSLDHIKARDLSVENAAEVSGYGIVPGTMAGNALPCNVTLALTANTGLTGRGINGRVYVIGLAKEKQALDAYDPVETAALAATWTALITAINAVGTQKFCVLSRYHGVDPATRKPIKRAVGIGRDVINFAAKDNTLDSQRRRLANHNRHRR